MSTAASFTLDPTLRTLSTAALLKRYKRLSPAERQTLGFTRPATDAEIATAGQAAGAPADFAGPVFSNPDGAKVSDDTESGIAPLRLPNGVSLQHQNFTGRMPADASTPPQAQIVGPHVQTISSVSSSTPLFDMSKAKPVGQPLFDMSKANPIDDLELHPPAAAGPHVAMHEHNLVTGKPNEDFDSAPSGATGDLKQALEGTVIGAGQVSTPGIALSLFRKHFPEAFNALPEAVKKNVAPAEKLPGQIITTGLMGMEGGLGEADRLPAAVPAGEARPVPAAAAPTGAPGPIQNLISRAITKFVAKRIPGLGATLDAAELAREISGALTEKPAPAAAPGATPAPQPVPMTEGTPWGKPILEKPAYPGADLPEAPSREALQARALEKPGAAPAEEPSASLGRIPGAKSAAAQPEAAAPAAAATPEMSTPHGGGIPRTLSGESALRQVLTGQDNANLIKIAKSRGINIAQESQLKPGVADSRLINKIIEDFSDDELDGMRSQYLENNRMGKHNFGDIGPEAWKTMGMQSYFPDVKIADAALRRTQSSIAAAEKAKSAPAGAPSPLQQKVSNLEDFIRKPATEAPASAKPAAKPKTSAPVEPPDLTDQLQKSLDLVKGNKDGVVTTAEPKVLLDRWGVDRESFAEGREQTRGMNPLESKDAIAKLSKSYKSGRTPDPVIETRDADNNIVEVDGRGRALAAHKAGIERIPVIIRRLQPIE